MDNFPDEILLEIFSKVPAIDLYYNCKFVCKRWLELSQDRTLKPHKIAILKETKHELAIKLLKDYSNEIECIDLCDRNDTNALLREIEKCDNLKCLKLKNCYGENTGPFISSPVSGDLLDALILNCLKLVHIALVKMELSRDNYLQRMSYASNLQKLQLKEVNDIYGVISDRTYWFTLTDLRLEDIGVSKEIALGICTCNSNTLTTIKLNIWDSNTSLDDDFLSVIGNTKNMKNLKLKFYSEAFTDAGFHHLNNLQELKKFQLLGAESISSESFIHFFSRPCVQKLIKINILGCVGVNEAVKQCIRQSCINLSKFFSPS